jgi:cysteine synthase
MPQETVRGILEDLLIPKGLKLEITIHHKHKIDQALASLAKAIRERKRAYRFRDNPFKNGQNCRAYKQQITNEILEDIARWVEEEK